ncbi:glycerol-3-phosphate dehydrogenase/oxidase [Rudaeicoccus suwonensis]|uniref:Glycerol-3-phosphate dehydrogenase n=1 Tax=Rudaeicoccus suwonensis TaxID=657409 RepID=A0A561E7F4_9MICO|nr:glycerol-3-phosphate dehydrogenase/oxidase [Rudaeicoccus suwonensis]TWE11534.1 glycerol-3-phosphate dehydrogenase [Rudaeicoccus suwonensis]
MTGDSRLNRQRRERELAEVTDGRVVDLLVIGLGITGAGVALDAATRGLSVVAIDAHDLAFGTSRWSSKLAHGGLRYLAKGRVGIAHESAVERGVLMTRTAPHLTRAVPWLVPDFVDDPRHAGALTYAGFVGGDLLRRVAHTPGSLLPRPRRIGMSEAMIHAPGLRRSGLRGATLGWDSQLTDDARLVVAVARTSAAHGARVLTRTRALEATGDGARVRDELTGSAYDIRARAVINATGVWADQLAPGISLRPSRGTHLVVRSEAVGAANCVVNAPVPGHFGRFVFTLPQLDGRTYIGLTDEAVDGPVPDEPTPTQGEVDFLLATVNAVLDRAITTDDVIGAYAGLRPLIEADGATADLSREHAVLVAPDGMVTVVGGKLTTYRRMAQDAVDRVVRERHLGGGPCITARTPLVGAASRDELARIDAPSRLIRRYGAEAPLLLTDPGRLAMISDEVPTIPAEFDFALSHEGALDVDDLLDRRTRVGLVAADRAAALRTAQESLAAYGTD